MEAKIHRLFDDAREGGDDARAAVVTRSGASASVEPHDGEESICVRDAAGALLFEHRPAENRSVVYAAGDLAFRARGRIELEGEAVQLRGRREVSVSSREVRLAATDDDGRPAAELGLLRRAAVLVAPLVSARAAAARVDVEDIEVAAGEVRTRARRMLSTVEHLEVTAGLLVERARDAYRETEGLSQTRAGRLRLVAEKTLHALGERTLFKAHKDMKLRGEKIYLE